MWRNGRLYILAAAGWFVGRVDPRRIVGRVDPRRSISSVELILAGVNRR